MLCQDLKTVPGHSEATILGVQEDAKAKAQQSAPTGIFSKLRKNMKG